MDAPFAQFGPDQPISPVIVSVPHAGRDYPPALLAALRVPVAALRPLEDRRVDAVALAARRSETILVQRRARAWIDLNRAEDERDPKVDAGARPGAPTTPKLRSGLGLVPARVSGAGALWRGRFAGAAIDDRIAADHRPYHARLALLLARTRAAFGTAVLLDLHSMPTLGAGRPRVVLGDRFGTSAGGRFVARAEAAVAAARMPTALNAPYAGGHVVHRHGDPRRGVHAIQLELDRTLYLDASLDGLGEGAAATAAIVRAVIDALADEALPSARMAAE